MAKSNFYWDGKIGRYRWRSNGKILSRNTMQNLVRGRIESARSQLVGLWDKLKDEEIDFKEFQKQGRDLIRTIHSEGLMLGNGGFDQTPSEDFMELARFLKNEEYPRWRRFQRQIANGRVSEKQIKLRLQMYGMHVRRSVEKGEESVANRTGYNFEERLLGACSPHCSSCVQYASEGVVPIGQLPVPTDRCECGPWCCCKKQFYKTLEEAKS